MFHPVIVVTLVVFIASLGNTDANLRSCRPKVCECKCRTKSVCQSIPNGDKITADIKKAITKEVGTLKQDLIAAQIQLINKAFRSHKLKPKKSPNLVYGRKTKGRDCAALYKKGFHKSGVYHIQPFQSGSKPHQSILAYCDMTTDGGGWTVFQRRQNGHVDFYRNWAAYKVGFGNPKGEHWLGNEVLHALTTHHPSELRVDLEELSGRKKYAKYGVFSVGGARTKYKLQVGRYSGTAGQYLSYNNGWSFTTYDKDNDGYGKNCAIEKHGAWWYRTCSYVNLNGRYNYKGIAKNWAAVIWTNNPKTSYMKTEMKVRPRNH